MPSSLCSGSSSLLNLAFSISLPLTGWRLPVKEEKEKLSVVFVSMRRRSVENGVLHMVC